MLLTLYVMNLKGFTVLKALNTRYGNILIAQVISSRDPNVQNDYYEEIHSYCKEHGLSFTDRLASQKPSNTSIAMAVGWRWLIKGYESIIVFHDSLLPRYRGFAPLVSSLINGEKHVGVTALLASDDYDKGPIIDQASLEVKYPVKIVDVIEKVSKLYAKLAIQVGGIILSGNTLQGTLQDETMASYSLWRDEEDYWIDWNQSAEKIKLFVDSVDYPYLGAAARIGGQKVAILNCDVIPDVQIENRTTGKVIFLQNGIPTVVCGQGLLKLTEIVDYENRQTILPLRKMRVRFYSV